ncbi:MAG: hypothetical protein AAF358_04710 [Pseudomonadota bacterium]
MRNLLRMAALLACISANAREASVEIAGVEIYVGMPESEAMSAFARVNCFDMPADSTAGEIRCAVGDGISPESDGAISFTNGVVSHATRNWHVAMQDENSYQAFDLLNSILVLMTGEDSHCVKIETHQYPERPANDETPYQPGSQTTIIAFPDRTISLQTQDLRGGFVLIKESLKRSPTPSDVRTKGQRMQWWEGCQFIQ